MTCPKAGYSLTKHGFTHRATDVVRDGPVDVLLRIVYLNLLRRDGTLCLLGMPGQPISFTSMLLGSRRRSIAGSGVGGLAETQEMLDFCAIHDITAEVEVLPIDKVNEAFERLKRNDVRYRFVLDLALLKG